MKIITIVGARPQFVKAATVSRAISKTTGITEKIIHTGQHYDENMSDVFFSEMDIPRPQYNLHVGGLNHGAMTGRMLEQIEAILLDEKPDFVLVYGDTNSTLAGALAAQKLHIPVAHVEAGLRSYNMRMPEEVNRILTDRLSTVLFCPTDTAIQTLKNEGYDKIGTRVVYSGDVMYDAALFYEAKAKKPDMDLPGKFILATLHRAENTDIPERLSLLVKYLNEINADIPVVLPLHPRTRKKIADSGLHPEFTICDPVSYFEMIYLLKNSSLVMTDSGGLQKESYFFNKHCVILRDETEWQELVDAKINFLYGSLSPLKEKVISLAGHSVNNDTRLYGDGHSAELIVETLKSYAS